MLNSVNNESPLVTNTTSQLSNQSRHHRQSRRSLGNVDEQADLRSREQENRPRWG
ncbi:hypothetical protein A2U01_0116176, partial [Trifolium medium]|nr:hypothetical protein [Trifolium medium]